MQEKIDVIKELDVENLALGSMTRFWVHVVSDGMAQPVLVPVMVAKGVEAGPVLGLTAAVHGNELNGLSVIQKVFQEVEVSELKGTLVGVPVVNVPGFL
ncbi:MAG: succinylglutamate desuccinylase/aspartoacylase family protein, partial [Bacteroidota bacterium]